MEGKNPSIWLDTRPGRRFAALRAKRKKHVDVVVVGAGISGVTAAALLVRAGKKVALVEMHRVGGGVTGGTTAHLTEVLDTRFHLLRSRFGDEGARLAREAHRAAIERIAEFTEELSIDCGFRRVPGFLFSENARDLSELEKERDACEAIGLSCAFTKNAPLPYDIAGALRFEDQATFHPREYLLALLEAARKDGLQVYEDTRVDGIEDGEPVTIETTHGTLTADELLVTTDAPIATRVLVHTKIAHYRSYVISAPVREDAADALFWDLDDPYHYLRIHDVDGTRQLIVGGEDHKVGHDAGEENARWNELERWTRDRFEIGPVRWRWSAQVVEPADGLSYVGRSPFSAHVWIATGHSGNGMTGGTMSAMLLSDEVLGKESPWTGLFDATRIKPIASVSRFVSENADVAAHLVGDRLRRDIHDVDEVHPGEGKLVRLGGETLAVHRDAGGELHCVSAVCTHLFCHVQWNAPETTWDCPCHGSRFDVNGDVLHGPAISPLERRELPAESEDEASP